jgi:hypothetical protein
MTFGLAQLTRFQTCAAASMDLSEGVGGLDLQSISSVSPVTKKDALNQSGQPTRILARMPHKTDRRGKRQPHDLAV